MTPQEIAQDLVKKYLPYMYCYSGSEMFTNTYNHSVALENAKVCAFLEAEQAVTIIRLITDIQMNDTMNKLWSDIKFEIPFVEFPKN